MSAEQETPETFLSHTSDEQKEVGAEGAEEEDEEEEEQPVKEAATGEVSDEYFEVPEDYEAEALEHFAEIALFANMNNRIDKETDGRDRVEAEETAIVDRAEADARELELENAAEHAFEDLAIRDGSTDSTEEEEEEEKEEE